MFHRGATEALMEQELEKFVVEDLPWKDNLLIKQAEGFMPTSMGEKMIQNWVNKTNILKPPGPGDPASKYEWTAKSKAPNLQRQTWSDPVGTKANETFEARVADFLNEVSEDTLTDYNRLQSLIVTDNRFEHTIQKGPP